MEANMLVQRGVILSSRPRRLTTAAETRRSSSVYNDNLFDELAISHLSRSLQATTGLRSSKNGYKSLVEVATMACIKFSPVQQRQLVTQSLSRAFPEPFPLLIRALLPQSRFTRELFAAFTTVFFVWLVGACEAKESELATGRREKNVVYIRKCRFLEESNCMGMCINLCKMPSQAFIKDSLGMPLTMIPNFDDMSCEMIFGMDPPSSVDDPALKQPCYKLCKTKQRHSQNCSD